MATSLYRKLHFSFWDDEYIREELDESDEAWLFSTLIQNPKSTACGIYKVTNAYLSMLTKIPKDKVKTIMDRFTRDGKVLRCEQTGEIFLVNTMKYARNLGNYKYLTQLRNELLLVKHQPFIVKWFEKLQEFGIKVDIKTEKGEGFTIEDVLKKEAKTDLLPGMPPSETEQEGEEAPKKGRGKGKGKGNKEPGDPNVKVVIDHYFKVFEEIMKVTPKLGPADAPTVKKELKNMDVERAKNLIEYAVDVFFRDKSDGGKGMTGTLKTCFAAFLKQSRDIEWQKRKWKISDSETPITTKRWWKE
jgi:hypothetical protein